MTQEDKELLLRDLCARLPYRVICEVEINVHYSEAHKPDTRTCKGNVWGVTINEAYTAWVYSYITIPPCGPEQNMCLIEECKPYLRPMSSMTPEECTQLFVLLPKHYVIYQDQIHNLDENGKILPEHIDIIIDFYNSHHLDWRGLIPKGLALEAPEGMYK